MRGSPNPFWVLVAAIRAEGGDYLNEEGTRPQFDTPEGLKAIGFYGDLYTKHKVAPLLAEMPSGGPDLMASNRVAIRNAPIWSIQTAKQLFKDFEWQILPAPRGQAGADGFSEVNFFSVTKASKNPEVAFDVLAKICEPKWMWQSVEMGGLWGSHKEFWDSPKLTADPNAAIFARMMKTVSAAVLPRNGRITQLTNTSNSEMDPIWTGQSVEATQLVKQIAPKLQAILDSAPASLEELAK